MLLQVVAQYPDSQLCGRRGGGEWAQNMGTVHTTCLRLFLAFWCCRRGSIGKSMVIVRRLGELCCGPCGAWFSVG